MKWFQIMTGGRWFYPLPHISVWHVDGLDVIPNYLSSDHIDAGDLIVTAHIRHSNSPNTILKFVRTEMFIDCHVINKKTYK